MQFQITKCHVLAEDFKQNSRFQYLFIDFLPLCGLRTYVLHRPVCRFSQHISYKPLLIVIELCAQQKILLSEFVDHVFQTTTISNYCDIKRQTDFVFLSIKQSAWHTLWTYSTLIFVRRTNEKQFEAFNECCVNLQFWTEGVGTVSDGATDEAETDRVDLFAVRQLPKTPQTNKSRKTCSKGLSHNHFHRWILCHSLVPKLLLITFSVI